jgi:hypothetical protein
MADLLLYAGIRANNELIDKKLAGAAALDFTGDIGPGDYIIGTGAAGEENISTTWRTQLDAYVAENEFQQNHTCVWNSNGYFRCGQACTWCVPAGVSRVMIEMWGPGGGTSSNCCCGGAPFGPNGAYIATTIDVEAGECICICAGCAYCCYAYQTTPGVSGGDSYFTIVPGTSSGQYCCYSACAMAGKSHCYTQWQEDSQTAGGFANQNSGLCSIPVGNQNNDGCGPNCCSGWNFCWDSGNDDVNIPPVFSSFWNSKVLCDAGADGFGVDRQASIFKVPGIWPCMYIPNGTLNGARTKNAPVPRYEDCICTICWYGNTCHGCCYGAPSLYGVGYLCGVPGAGGAGGVVDGGCQACGGDSGRLGMIKIHYNCA